MKRLLPITVVLLIWSTGSLANAPAEFFTGVGESQPDTLMSSSDISNIMGDVDNNITLGLKAFNSERYHVAAGYFQAEADQGNPSAELFLAMLYSSGRGVPKDTKKALNLLELSASKGIVKSQTLLGYYYFYGHTVEENHDKAEKWFERAANQGDPESQEMLAVILLSKNNPSLYEEAATLLKLSLDEREVEESMKVTPTRDYKEEALLLLGQLYLSGSGVSQNKAIAYGLFTQVEPDLPPSITSKMSQQDIQQGQMISEAMKESGNITNVIKAFEGM